MPKLNFVKVHGTTMDDAKERVRAMVEEFEARHAKIVDRVEWRSDGRGAEAKGTGFSAMFQVDDRLVRVDVKLSFIAIPLKGRVEAGIRGQLDSAFPG